MSTKSYNSVKMLGAVPNNDVFMLRIANHCLVSGGLEDILFFASYWECHHPNLLCFVTVLYFDVNLHRVKFMTHLSHVILLLLLVLRHDESASVSGFQPVGKTMGYGYINGKKSMG